MTVFAYILTLCLSLLVSKGRAMPIPNVSRSEETELAELKCGQWKFYGTRIGATYASGRWDCHAKCIKTSNSVGRCDVFSYDKASGYCAFFDSSILSSQPMMYYANQQLCSTTYKGDEPPWPEGGCKQIRILGYPLHNVGSQKTAADCHRICQGRSDCNYSLFRLGGDKDNCRLMKSDKSWGSVRFYPNESVCENINCGQWFIGAWQLSISTVPSEEHCKIKTYNRDIAYLFRPLLKKKNCILYLPKPEGADYLITYAPGEKMCSLFYSYPRTKPVVDPAYSHCKQEIIYGTSLMPVLGDNISHGECIAMCARDQYCSHAIIGFDERSDPICDLVRGNRLEAIYEYVGGSVACRRTAPGLLPLPDQITNGKRRCGQYEFYGSFIKNVTVLSEDECEKECTGDCDAFLYNFHIKKNNCNLYNSMVRNEDDPVRYPANTKLCSTKFGSITPTPIEGGCPQERVFGYAMSIIELIRDTAFDCYKQCEDTPGCTHAMYDTKDLCTIFFEGRRLNEEYLFAPFESACRVRRASR